MRIRAIFLFVIGIVGIGAFSVFAQDQERNDLESARASYRSTVKAHGQQSAEAAAARDKLRGARRSYHNAIRQQRRAAGGGRVHANR